MHTTQCEKNMTVFKLDNCLPKIYLKKVGKIIITVIVNWPPSGRSVHCKEARKT